MPWYFPRQNENKLFYSNEYVREYIYDLVIISNGNFKDHLKKLKVAGFNINAEKSFFARDNLEYLGFKITRKAIMPLPDKVQAIKHMYKLIKNNLQAS